MPETSMPDLQAVAREIVDANQYMTLATADADGRPWASPVWFASVDCREFVWVSSPEARHSRNLAVRPQLAIVIFDSQQPPGTGAGVYVGATGEQVPESDLDRALRIFSSLSETKLGTAWARSEVERPARLRLYHAVASEHFVLGGRDERLPVNLA